MKLQPDPKQALNTVTRYESQYVEINEQRFENSILIMPEGPVQRWHIQGFDDLQKEDFQQILDMRPALVIFGSGQRLRFLHPSVLQDLHSARIGIETMDTQAACRTYNILMGEGRLVLGAFLLEKA